MKDRSTMKNHLTEMLSSKDKNRKINSKKTKRREMNAASLDIT
jgi:hypothetical protein